MRRGDASSDSGLPDARDLREKILMIVGVGTDPVGRDARMVG
jgi:hypothetical protein